MVGYQRVANKMPNYDISDSTLWEVFNQSIEQAEAVLKESE